MDKNGRQLRIHKKNTIHHVMIRGNNRQRIFFSEDYFHYFLEILEKSSKKFDHKIISYCLMSNHAHLIVKIYNSPLSKVMQYINFRYARWLNHKHKRIGHLFQGRYRSLEVNNETYLINLCRYVHFNPITAKIVPCLDDYAWSSHFYYLHGNAPEWIETKFMLDILQSITNQNYSEFINKTSDRDTWKPLMRISESGKVEYDKNSIKTMQIKEISPLLENAFVLTPYDVLEKICEQLCIEKMSLLGPSRNRLVAKQRILLAQYLLRYTKLNITDVAEFLQRTRSTLRRQMREMDLYPEKYFSLEIRKKIDNILTQ